MPAMNKGFMLVITKEALADLITKRGLLDFGFVPDDALLTSMHYDPDIDAFKLVILTDEGVEKIPGATWMQVPLEHKDSTIYRPDVHALRSVSLHRRR